MNEAPLTGPTIGFTPTQMRRLMSPVKEDRVEQKRGMSYVPQQEVRAELIRIFGPGNADHTMTNPELLYERMIEPGDYQYPTSGDGKKPYFVSAYKVGCTLRVRDYHGNPIYECTEWHVEENAPLPNRGEAHAMAVTSAQSYALRRAAISLGDAFGLHLYDGGKLTGLVINSLQLEGDLQSPDADPYAPRNIRLKLAQPEIAANAAQFEKNLQTPPADPETGEVQDAPVKPDVPVKPTRTRKAPAAAQPPAEEQPEAPTATVTRSMNDAFKKPTEQKAV